MDAVFERWRNSLKSLMDFYSVKRGPLLTFFPTMFVFFFLLNIGCYWLALFTAFPELVQGDAVYHYFKIQFPVAFFGAVFDVFSFFVTIFIVRHALRTRNNLVYTAHLSIDLFIAILAAMWVLFVFSLSGWIVGYLDAKSPPPAPVQIQTKKPITKSHQKKGLSVKRKPESQKPMIKKKAPASTMALSDRSNFYIKVLKEAFANPFANRNNIYFGAIMGVSASLPSCLHIFMFLRAIFLVNINRHTLRAQRNINRSK
jgi:hypothetical protein